MLHLTPNQPSACPESGTLGTVVRQDVRHNKRPAHTDWRNTDGWDLGGFPLGLRHMSGAEGPLGTPVQHCHSSLIESLIGQGNHMTNQEKILHSYYTTAVKIFHTHTHNPNSVYCVHAALAESWCAQQWHSWMEPGCPQQWHSAGKLDMDTILLC